MIVISMFQVAYLTNFKPADSLLGYRLEIFNEATTVVLVDFLTVFSAARVHDFDLEADIFFLSCLFCNLLVHLVFLIKSSIVEGKEECKKRKRKGKSACCCISSKHEVKKY